MIKNMSSKMTTNSQLSTTEPKNTNQLSKQLEEQNHRNGDHLRGFSVGRGRRVNGVKGPGNKKHKW